MRLARYFGAPPWDPDLGRGRLWRSLPQRPQPAAKGCARLQGAQQARQHARLAPAERNARAIPPLVDQDFQWFDINTVDIDLKAKLGKWERSYGVGRPHGAQNCKTPYETLCEKKYSIDPLSRWIAQVAILLLEKAMSNRLAKRKASARTAAPKAKSGFSD
jgi:hypothetical protein